jgi:hypothetical protein
MNKINLFQRLIEQLSNDKLPREVSLLQTTTIRPFSPMPPLRRQPRPVIDGNYFFDIKEC